MDFNAIPWRTTTNHEKVRAVLVTPARLTFCSRRFLKSRYTCKSIALVHTQGPLKEERALFFGMIRS